MTGVHQHFQPRFEPCKGSATNGRKKSTNYKVLFLNDLVDKDLTTDKFLASMADAGLVAEYASL